MFYQQILLDLFYIYINYDFISPFWSYIVVTPSMIGFSEDFLCHFHLGLIWISLLLSFFLEHFFMMILKMVY